MGRSSASTATHACPAARNGSSSAPDPGSSSAISGIPTVAKSAAGLALDLDQRRELVAARRADRARSRRGVVQRAATAAGRPPCGAGATARRAPSSSAADGRSAQRVGALDGAADAEVADGEHVGPPEREHQEHVRAPLADALDRDRARPMTSSSESSSRRSSSSSPASTCSASERRKATFARERPTATRSSSGSSARISLRRRRAAVEALEQAPVDRARRVHRELLADDRAHERAVVIVGRRPRGRGSARSAALVEQPREHRVGARAGARHGVRAQAWPSTRARARRCWSSTSAGSSCPGRMWWTACATAIAASREAGGDQLELAVEGRDVAARPHAVQRRLRSARRRSIAPFSISKPHSFSGPSAVLKPSWSRIASHGDARPRCRRPRSGRAATPSIGAVAGDVLDLVGHVQVDAARSAWASMTSATVASWARKPSRRCTSVTRSAVSSRLTTQSQARVAAADDHHALALELALLADEVVGAAALPRRPCR